MAVHLTTSADRRGDVKGMRVQRQPTFMISLFMTLLPLGSADARSETNSQQPRITQGACEGRSKYVRFLFGDRDYFGTQLDCNTQLNFKKIEGKANETSMWLECKGKKVAIFGAYHISDTRRLYIEYARADSGNPSCTIKNSYDEILVRRGFVPSGHSFVFSCSPRHCWAFMDRTFSTTDKAN
jgi:hypothetical protein